MSETLRKDIDNLIRVCEVLKGHIRKEDKSTHEKKLLEHDLKHLRDEFSRLNLLMNHDEFTSRKIGDAAIVERFKKENSIVDTLRMAIGPLTSRTNFVTDAVYNHNERAIQDIENKLNNIIRALQELHTFNEELKKVIKRKESELHHLKKLVS